jgi:hypothetical protein
MPNEVLPQGPEPFIKCLKRKENALGLQIHGAASPKTGSIGVCGE